MSNTFRRYHSTDAVALDAKHENPQMKPHITNKNLPQLLIKTRESLLSHFRPIFQHFDLTEQQWRILRSLDELGQLEPRQLCELCQIQSPSMVGMLTRMEQIGLISRHKIPKDQRRMLIRLAPKGDQLVSKMAGLIDAQYQYIERAMGKPVLDDLFNALEQFNRANEQPIERVILHPSL